MKVIDRKIECVDLKIAKSEKRLTALKKSKEKLIEITNLPYKNVDFAYGVGVVAENISNLISGMSITQGRYEICASFNISPTLHKGVKVYKYPYKNVIATIHKGNAIITVHNYDVMIGDDCKVKNKFLKRIKKTLINYIIKEKLNLSENSFNYKELNKLLLLK